MKKYLLLLLFLKHSSFPYVKIEKAIILAAAQYVLSSCYIDESFTQTQKICQNFGLSINPKTSLWKIQSNKYFQNEITPIFKEAFSIINENKELSVNEYHKTQSTGITKYFYNIKNIASNFLGTSEKTIDKELKKRIVDFCNISNIENREKITDTKTIEKYASENHSISLFSSSKFSIVFTLFF